MRTKLKPIELFVPFTNITRREEDGAMIVEGYCYVNPRVKGDRYSITRAAMEAATPGYNEFPAVREMHQPIAAGTGLEVIWDEKGCFLRSECVDESTQKKIDKKVLRGYSIGVNALTVRGDDVESLDWVETSYVDRPKDPDAVFLYRADGFDWDAEVEVTVLDESPASSGNAGDEATPPAADTSSAAGVETPEASPAVVPQEQPAAAAPDSDPISIPASSLDPSGEIIPAAEPSSPAAGDSSPTEEQRAALIAAGLSPELAGSVEVVQASDERALGSPVVPVRENLDSSPTPSVNEADKQLGGGPTGAYRVEQAPTGMWCVYGPAGDKLGEFETQALANAHVAACKEQMQGSGDPAAAAGRVASVTPERVAAIARELESIVARAAELQREMAGGPPAAPAAAEAIWAAAGVAGGAAPETVSRTDVREEPTDPIQRLETVTAELSRVQVAFEAEKLLRATAEAEVQRLKPEVERLRNLPLDREKPVVRYPHALSREFIANLGNEAESAIAVLRADYEAAKKEAEEQRHGDRDKLNRATEKMILRASQLAEHGIYVS